MIPSGTILIGGFGDDPFLFMAPDGATTYPPPPSAPTAGSGLQALCRLSTGDIASIGGGIPGCIVGVWTASDLTVRSEYPGLRQNGAAIAADANGFWYTATFWVNPDPAHFDQQLFQFARLNADSVEVATWDVAPSTIPDGDYTWGEVGHAMAVSENGQTLYLWATPNAFTAGDERLKSRILVFSLAGADSDVGRLTPDFSSTPGFGSLLLVPDGSGDLLVAFAHLNDPYGVSPGAIRRYRPNGTLVWTAGAPAGASATNISWLGLALGAPGDPHFLAWAYDGNTTNTSGARYCWFSYATGAPDESRNFEPEAGSFQVDSQFVILAVPVGDSGPPPTRPGCVSTFPIDPNASPDPAGCVSAFAVDPELSRRVP